MASAWSLDEQQVPSLPTDNPLLHVLVVEDDPDCAECLAFLLRLNGIAVETSADAATALASLHAHLPEVVLMDIGLPDMEGHQLARRVRTLAGPKPPLLIALTGYVEEIPQRRVAEECFDHYLTKPVDPAALLALLEGCAASL